MLTAFLLYMLFCSSVDSLLVNLKKSCVPTQVAKGQCHVCVCNKDGIFKCQSTGCQTVVNSGKLVQGECQPLMTYQYEDLYCTCNYEGKWMSYNCRSYFQNITTEENNIRNHLRKNFTSNGNLKRRGIPRIKEGDSCVAGNIYKLACNTCQCGPKNALICTKMLCLDKKFQEEIKNIKNKRNKTTEHQRINRRKAEMYKKLQRFPKLPNGDCVPGRIYRDGCRKCLCAENKELLCTEKCYSSVSFSITDNEILQLETRPLANLPKLPHMGKQCDPGKMYAVSCNLCYCSEERDLVCTLKYCLNVKSYAQVQANKLTGTPCTKDYIKQCAQCQCVNHTSVCKKLKTCLSDLGGKQLLASAGDKLKLSLDASKEKCIPNAIYKVHCNDCFCQPDGSLRCTQKTCLTHSQAKDLNDRKTYLETHGL